MGGSGVDATYMQDAFQCSHRGLGPHEFLPGRLGPLVEERLNGCLHVLGVAEVVYQKNCDMGTTLHLHNYHCFWEREW